jgi:hypothetical protein
VGNCHEIPMRRPPLTDEVLVASGEAVVVTRFEKPPRRCLPVGQNTKSRYLSGDGVSHSPVLSEVDSFGTEARLELCLP